MRKKKKKSPFVIICIICLFILNFSYLYISSDKIIKEYALKKYESVSSLIGYECLDEVLSDNCDFASLVKIERDNQGEIIMVQADNYAINKVAAKISKNAYKLLNEKIEQGVDIPLGAFTGIRLIEGFGKKINMKLLSVSSVKSEIVSSFEQAGINQTRQTLYLNVHSDACITTKIGNKTIANEISVLIYDNLIVGKVPSVLINPITLGKG